MSIPTFATTILFKPSPLTASFLRQAASKSSPVFRRQAFSTRSTVPRSALTFKDGVKPSLLARSFQQQSRNQSSFSIPGLTSGSKTTRFLTSAGIVIATIVGTDFVFNRETRDSLSPAEAGHLHSTFGYLAGGLGIVTATAVGLHRTGWSRRIMMANPWVVIIGSLAGGIGCMMGTRMVGNDKPVLKHSLWFGFNAFQALTLSPLLFLNPALLYRAGFYTAGIVGSLSYIGATARNDQYIWMGGPLLAGVTLVALSSLAPLVLPVTAFRTLAITESISLYGGLAVFSGFVLYDTQKIISHGRIADEMSKRTGRNVQADPIGDSISLELDFINIFIRMVQILGMGGNRK